MAEEDRIEEAKRRIEEAIAEGDEGLNLMGLDLTTLEPLADDLARASSVKALELDGNPITNISPVARMKSLNRLDLIDTNITDISPIAGMTGITRLDLSNTQITDITPIAGMTGITKLFLSNTQITDITPIAGMTGITELNLNNSQITDISPIAGMTGITALDLSGTQITDITPIAGITGITTLDLSGTQITDITPIAGMTGITTLDLSGTQITEITPIAGMTGITRLDLSGTQITDITPIAGITGITTLDLSGTQITDITPIAGMTGITALYLSGTQITDITPIAGMTGITTLDLSGTQITEITPIAGMTGITALYLSGTQITDITPIAGMTGITTLDLSGTQITDITPIAGVTGITTLDLSGTQITDLRPIRRLQQLMEYPDVFWGGLMIKHTPACAIDPKIAEIAEVEDSADRARQLFAYLEDWVPPVDAGDVPAQSADGLQYGVNEDGVVDYAVPVPDTTLPSEVAELHAVVLTETRTLRETCQSGRNIPFKPLADVLERYEGALATNADLMKGFLVWKLGNDLRLILKSNHERRNDDLDSMPPLGIDMRNTLEGLVQTHNVFCEIHPSLRRFDRAYIDPLERHQAEQNRKLLGAALEAFAVQVALMRGEIIADLQSLHDEAQSETKTALRAMKIEQESIENLIKAILVQGVLEAKDPSLMASVRGDLRSWAVGGAAGLAGTALGPDVAANFPQLVTALQPYISSLLTAWHGTDYPMQDVIKYVARSATRSEGDDKPE